MVRTATIEDVPLIRRMLESSAAEQGFPDELCVTEHDLREDGFGAGNPRFQVLIAELDGTPAGMALYFFNYSTWGSRDGLYLEDLYVDPQFRGRAVAQMLMSALAGVAEQRGCKRFQWVVHTANATALPFYHRMGARALEDWRLMSIKGEAIARLARSEMP